MNVVAANGNVGIGTAVPGEMLQIVGGNGKVDVGKSWLTTSDARLKTNVKTIEGALEKVLALRGVRFDVTKDSKMLPGKPKHIGFIAQELREHFPEIVATDKKGYFAVDYDKMSAILVEAIKEQQKQIESLKSRITSCEKDSGSGTSKH